MFGLDSDQSLRLLYLVALLVFVAGGIGYRRSGKGAAFRHLVVWAVAILALVTLYAYRAPLISFAEPVLAELDPSRAVQVMQVDGAEELVIRRGGDGHFHVDAGVNGESVRFLVDTGASSTVLTLRDAERSGVETEFLEFNRPVQTANGIAYFARATLRSLEIGPYRFADVTVGIMPAEALNVSLLGMSTIDRFASWRIEGDRMVMVP